MGISVRAVWLSIRSCELQTLAPKVTPFYGHTPPTLVDLLGRLMSSQASG